MTTLPAPWSILHAEQLAAREATTVPVADLDVAAPVRAYLEKRAPNGVWTHQRDALAAHLAGRHVCISTPTASGKTLVFHAAALEELAKDRSATILAIYPMKALGQEQEERWVEALRAAGIDGDVNRIDGGVDSATRNQHCRRSRVIVATPDVIHTWMLGRLGQRQSEGIAKFLRKLALVVIDEAHTYTGAFGSSAAFVFRRLQHALALLGGKARFVAASATMADPARHVEALVGEAFEVIGPEQDGSPRQPVEMVMARADDGADFHSSLEALFADLRDRGERFIAFFDSRKSTEQMAAILQRSEDKGQSEDFDHLADSAVLPYKAGYEAEHRKLIQERLANGSLVGVLSTSAMELGLDIPNLHTVVLVGVPGSGTSLRQRIGRVGRSIPGRVIVVHAGSLSDDVAFQHPTELLRRPLNESTIHLENRRIQYLHAMALARPNGEHDSAALLAGRPASSLESTLVAWPQGFLALCAEERAGRVPWDLRDMKSEAGEQPTTTFMIRDVEAQFDVELRRGMDRSRLGTLTYSQVMREAYPGAAYYYTGKSYRVLHVDVRARKIVVQRCPAISTQPVPVHSRLTPQRGNAQGHTFADLHVVETELQLWRAVRGFREKRGAQAQQVNYPCTEPVRFNNQSFSRTIFTSGVCLVHPVLDEEGVDLQVLTSLLQEAFRLVVPVERQDIDADADTLRASWGPMAKGRRFLCLFDQASGSLRLTGRLREPETLRKVLEMVAELAEQRDTVPVGNDPREVSGMTRIAARTLRDAACCESSSLGGLDAVDELSRVPVLLPRSHAKSAQRPDAVFEVHKVFMPRSGSLSYRGVWILADGTRLQEVVAVDGMEAADEEVVRGFYDLETGEEVAA